MSNKINARLGLKPQTRKRQATHGADIISSARCPKCPGTHVIEHRVHGVPTRLCGFCGHVWTENKCEV